MLFNPNWKKETKPDVHSLESLIQWLESKDPEESYVYTSSTSCLLSQYYTEKGYRAVLMGARSFRHGFFSRTYLPHLFNDIALYGTCTFGRALERARDFQRECRVAA